MILDLSLFLRLAGALVTLAAGAGLSLWLDNYQLQVGTSLAMLCILCWGWNIVGGYMGYPSFATVTFFGIGAYADAILQTAGIPVQLAWVLAALTGALMAAVLGLPLLRLKGHYFAIGTIATVEVCREIANNWEWLTGGAVGLNVPIQAGSPEYVGRFFFIAMLSLAALAFIATVLVAHSRFGFGLRCIKQNEQAASMVGVNVFKYKVAAFMLSGALCAGAGGIYASMVGFIEPKDAFSILTTIEIPVMVMLGGMGTMLGPLVGGVFYVLLKEFVWANFINWHSGILGLIIVLVVYYLPSGVFGLTWSKIGRRFLPRSAPETARAAS